MNLKKIGCTYHYLLLLPGVWWKRKDTSIYEPTRTKQWGGEYETENLRASPQLGPIVMTLQKGVSQPINEISTATLLRVE